MNAARSALTNSLLLGFATATIGTVLMGLLAWLIYRSRLPGSGAIEYVVMFPQAVPRLVFAFGLMWAWVVFPVPIYGTIWLLLIAYLTAYMNRVNVGFGSSCQCKVTVSPARFVTMAEYQPCRGPRLASTMC